MDGHLALHGGALPLVATTWFAMTAAMMTPVVAPWVRAYARLLAPSPGPGRRGAWGSAAAFASGYGVVWAGYSVAMAGLQLALASRTFLIGDRVAPVAGALVLIGAGLFQFSALKASCLTHCRNPLGYFLQRWHDRPPSGFRLGFGHGLFCLGCCWALMLTAFAVGTMHLAWMLVLAVVAVAEQLLPQGRAVARVVGAGLVAWGGWTLFALALRA